MHFAACGNTDCAAFGYGVASRRDFDFAIIEHIRLFRDRLQVGGKRFGHHIHVGTVRLDAARNIVNIEGNFVNARFLFVVAEFDFRLILLVALFVVGRKVSLRFDRLVDARKPCALFTGGIRVVFLVARHGCRAHQKLINAVGKRFPRQFGIGFVHIIAQNGDRTRHVGRRHARARKRFVTAGNGARDLAAVRRDLGFEFKARSGPPTREIRHERPCGIAVVKGDGARVARYTVQKQIARVHAHRAGGNGIVDFAERHADRTRYIIIDNTADRAVRHGVLHFFRKIDVAALDESDRSAVFKRIFHRIGIVRRAPYAADDNIFER